MGQKKQRTELIFLITRGLWLVFVEVIIITLAGRLIHCTMYYYRFIAGYWYKYDTDGADCATPL